MLCNPRVTQIALQDSSPKILSKNIISKIFLKKLFFLVLKKLVFFTTFFLWKYWCQADTFVKVCGYSAILWAQENMHFVRSYALVIWQKPWRKECYIIYAFWWCRKFWKTEKPRNFWVKPEYCTVMGSKKSGLFQTLL